MPFTFGTTDRSEPSTDLIRPNVQGASRRDNLLRLGYAHVTLAIFANAMKIEFRSHVTPNGLFPAVKNNIKHGFAVLRFVRSGKYTSHKYDRAICGFLAVWTNSQVFCAERFQRVWNQFFVPVLIADKVDGKKERLRSIETKNGRQF